MKLVENIEKENNISLMDKSQLEENQLEDIDIYKVIVENKYHNLIKYKSAGVLEQEKTILDEIIEYKKSNNFEYDFFDTKKNIIDMEVSKIQTNIICGNLTFADYKKLLAKQLSHEERLIEFLSKDSDLNEEEKHKANERIKNRINILNEELKQEVDEEEEEELNESKVNKNNLEDVSEGKF